MTDVVVEYLGALQAERGAARNTLDAYRRDLTDFTRFLNDHRRTLSRVGPDDIVEYLERLRTRGLRPASVARRGAAPAAFAAANALAGGGRRARRGAGRERAARCPRSDRARAALCDGDAGV